MPTYNWELIRRRLNLIRDKVAPFGKDKPIFHIDPAASLSEVEKWERENDLQMPPSLKSFFTEFSSRVWLYYYFGNYVKLQDSFSFCSGYCEISLVPRPWSWEDINPPDDVSEEEKIKLWGEESLKIVFMTNGGGDDYAIRPRGAKDEQVCYIDHETSAIVPVGKNLFDFLDRYTQLGCMHQYWNYSHIITPDGIDVNAVKAQPVKNWFCSNNLEIQ